MPPVEFPLKPHNQNCSWKRERESETHLLRNSRETRQHMR